LLPLSPFFDYCFSLFRRHYALCRHIDAIYLFSLICHYCHAIFASSFLRAAHFLPHYAYAA